MLLVICFLKSGAQTKEYGIWSELEIEKEIGKFKFMASGELRNSDVLNKVSRYGIGAGVSYNVFKPLSVGVSYEYYKFYDEKYLDYQPRQRYNVFIVGEQKFGRFSISIKERFQRTIKDESDRLTESGTYDTYKVNPEYTWRNRVKVKYDIPNFPITPAFSVESFYQLNNPGGNRFDQLRYILSLGYNVTESQKLEFLGLINQEINVSNPVQTTVFGVGYKFSFK